MSKSNKKSNKAVNRELIAICEAAEMAGMTYGKFVSQLKPGDQKTIIQNYYKQIDNPNTVTLNDDLSIDDNQDRHKDDTTGRKDAL